MYVNLFNLFLFQLLNTKHRRVGCAYRHNCPNEDNAFLCIYDGRYVPCRVAGNSGLRSLFSVFILHFIKGPENTFGVTLSDQRLCSLLHEIISDIQNVSTDKQLNYIG